MKLLCGLVSLSIALAAVSHSIAGELDIGPEIWVDGPTGPGGDVSQPDVAVAPNGDRIYVWSPNGVNTDGPDIYLRRFDAAGNPLDDAQRVNTLLAESQRAPRVAVRADGSFLVAWRSSEPDDWYVRSQLFDADGVPVGDELLVSELSALGRGTDINVDVAALRDVPGSVAAFVVSWQSRLKSGDDDDRNSIEARLIGADGLPVGSQFQVNTTGQGNQFWPAVTELEDGGFFVVWAVPGISGRRFDHTGAGVGDDFRIDNSGFSGQREPDVAVGREGQVLVAWEDPDEPDNSEEVRARLFDAELTPLGNDFRVNNLILGDVYIPKVADFGALGFLVVWSANNSAGTDADEDSIQGRIVTGHNAFADFQGQLNLFEENDQNEVGAHGMNGQIGLTWQSRTYGEVTSNNVIVGRHIASFNVCGIFCDGFEDL